jgi:hypothetical protein
VSRAFFGIGLTLAKRFSLIMKDGKMCENLFDWGGQTHRRKDRRQAKSRQYAIADLSD